MGRRSEWQVINARLLDPRFFGRVHKALRHTRLPDTYLLHVKFLSRKHPCFRQRGLWAVISGTTVLRRLRYCKKSINRAPVTWANGILGLHQEGTLAREAEREAAAKIELAGELLEAIGRWKAQLPPEEWKSNFTLRSLRREYQDRYGPLGDDDLPLLGPPVDPRKPRFRSVLNYSLPSHFDELAKVLYYRNRSSAGTIRRYKRAQAERRRRQRRRQASELNTGGRCRGRGGGSVNDCTSVHRTEGSRASQAGTPRG